jgi:NAD-specific glutamate dehydrogenase
MARTTVSIFSTDFVNKKTARRILLNHLKEVRRKIKADPEMSADYLDKLLNTYVKGNDEYWRTNFIVIDS